MRLGRNMVNKPRINTLNFGMDSDKKVLDVVYQKRDTSKVQISNLLLHPPDKYLIDCYSLSRWQCCILIGWEERASPAGGHVQ